MAASKHDEDPDRNRDSVPGRVGGRVPSPPPEVFTTADLSNVSIEQDKDPKKLFWRRRRRRR